MPIFLGNSHHVFGSVAIGGSGDRSPTVGWDRKEKTVHLRKLYRGRFVNRPYGMVGIAVASSSAFLRGVEDAAPYKRREGIGREKRCIFAGVATGDS